MHNQQRQYMTCSGHRVRHLFLASKTWFWPPKHQGSSDGNLCFSWGSLWIRTTALFLATWMRVGHTKGLTSCLKQDALALSPKGTSGRWDSCSLSDLSAFGKPFYQKNDQRLEDDLHLTQKRISSSSSLKALLLQTDLVTKRPKAPKLPLWGKWPPTSHEPLSHWSGLLELQVTRPQMAKSKWLPIWLPSSSASSSSAAWDSPLADSTVEILIFWFVDLPFLQNNDPEGEDASKVSSNKHTYTLMKVIWKPAELGIPPLLAEDAKKTDIST